MILYWGPVLAWMGLIFFFSSLPHLDSGLGTWDFILRKGAHVFEYVVLTGLLIRAVRNTWKSLSWRAVLGWGAAVAILYSALDEIHQAYVPGRGPSVRDVLIDTVGVGLAVLLIHTLNTKSDSPKKL
jgi:VanZ family protein